MNQPTFDESVVLREAQNATKNARAELHRAVAGHLRDLHANSRSKLQQQQQRTMHPDYATNKNNNRASSQRSGSAQPSGGEGAGASSPKYYSSGEQVPESFRLKGVCASDVTYKEIRSRVQSFSISRPKAFPRKDDAGNLTAYADEVPAEEKLRRVAEQKDRPALKTVVERRRPTEDASHNGSVMLNSSRQMNRTLTDDRAQQHRSSSAGGRARPQPAANAPGLAPYRDGFVGAYAHGPSPLPRREQTSRSPSPLDALGPRPLTRLEELAMPKSTGSRQTSASRYVPGERMHKETRFAASQQQRQQQQPRRAASSGQVASRQARSRVEQATQQMEERSRQRERRGAADTAHDDDQYDDGGGTNNRNNRQQQHQQHTGNRSSSMLRGQEISAIAGTSRVQGMASAASTPFAEGWLRTEQQDIQRTDDEDVPYRRQVMNEETEPTPAPFEELVPSPTRDLPRRQASVHSATNDQDSVHSFHAHHVRPLPSRGGPIHNLHDASVEENANDDDDEEEEPQPSPRTPPTAQRAMSTDLSPMTDTAPRHRGEPRRESPPSAAFSNNAHHQERTSPPTGAARQQAHGSQQQKQQSFRFRPLGSAQAHPPSLVDPRSPPPHSHHHPRATADAPQSHPRLNVSRAGPRAGGLAPSHTASSRHERPDLFQGFASPPHRGGGPSHQQATRGGNRFRDPSTSLDTSPSHEQQQAHHHHHHQSHHAHGGELHHDPGLTAHSHPLHLSPQSKVRPLSEARAATGGGEDAASAMPPQPRHREAAIELLQQIRQRQAGGAASLL